MCTERAGNVRGWIKSVPRANVYSVLFWLWVIKAKLVAMVCSVEVYETTVTWIIESV